MKVRDWLNKLSTAPGLQITAREREKRAAEKARVLAKAKTTIETLRVAVCRQAKGTAKIGDSLLYRLAEATKGERHRIFVRDERPEP